MHTHMQKHMQTSIHTDMHTCTPIYICTSAHENDIHKHIHLYMRTHAYIDTNMQTHIYRCIHMYIDESHIYIRACINKHAHYIYTWIYIHKQSRRHTVAHIHANRSIKVRILFHTHVHTYINIYMHNHTRHDAVAHTPSCTDNLCKHRHCDTSHVYTPCLGCSYCIPYQ